jgi:hypothetical protein
LSYSALARADDEAVAGGFNDRSRDDMKVIHAENSLDLSEEPSQKPEISAAHPNGSLSLPERVARLGGQRRQASIVFKSKEPSLTRRKEEP